MKHSIPKILSIFLFAGALFSAFSMRAELLDETFDWKHLEELKLGYYIGSFDPIHLGHQDVIDQALSKYVDYVLIYPVPGGDQFKNRTDLKLRQKMIASIYQDHPKVLITYWTPKELQLKFNSCAFSVDILGIIGSDVVTENLMSSDVEVSENYRAVFMRGITLKEKHTQDTIGALMALKANSFLVALRGDIDLSYLEGQIDDRPIYAFIQSKNNSSTEVRNAIRDKKSFEQFLSLSVQTIIKQEGLYEFSFQN